MRSSKLALTTLWCLAGGAFAQTCFEPLVPQDPGSGAPGIGFDFSNYKGEIILHDFIMTIMPIVKDERVELWFTKDEDTYTREHCYTVIGVEVCTDKRLGDKYKWELIAETYVTTTVENQSTPLGFDLDLHMPDNHRKQGMVITFTSAKDEGWSGPFFAYSNAEIPPSESCDGAVCIDKASRGVQYPFGERSRNSVGFVGSVCYSIPETCDVEHPEWVGDGFCDGPAYNSPQCQFDGGDCCVATCDDNAVRDCGSNGYECVDPEALRKDCGNCLEQDPTHGPGCTIPGVTGCVCTVDSFCCDNFWDRRCAEIAENQCTQLCPAATGWPAGDCAAWHPTRGCSNLQVQQCVCREDATCCTVMWDRQCAEIAIDVCGATPNAEESEIAKID